MAIALIAVLCGGCQNNGDIGMMFGVWRLDSFSVGGELRSDRYIDNTTFLFQSDVMEVVSQYDGYMSAYQNYGTWAWKDENTLIFNFQHHDNRPASEQSAYTAPYWICFTGDEPMEMRISDRIGKKMTLTWQYEGIDYVYKLKKTD